MNTSNITNYKPKDFSELLGMSVKTLQRWDREGTLEKPQNRHSSMQILRNKSSRESVGMEKIFCKMKADRKPWRG